MKNKTAGMVASIGLLATVFTGCASTGYNKEVTDIPATAADACVESEIDAQKFSAWNKGLEPPFIIGDKLFSAIKNHCKETYGDLRRHRNTTGVEANSFLTIASPTLRGEIHRVLTAPHKPAAPK